MGHVGDCETGHVVCFNPGLISPADSDALQPTGSPSVLDKTSAINPPGFIGSQKPGETLHHHRTGNRLSGAAYVALHASIVPADSFSFAPKRLQGLRLWLSYGCYQAGPTNSAEAPKMVQALDTHHVDALMLAAKKTSLTPLPLPTQ